jgi:hypothetical protein
MTRRPRSVFNVKFAIRWTGVEGH